MFSPLSDFSVERVDDRLFGRWVMDSLSNSRSTRLALDGFSSAELSLSIDEVAFLVLACDAATLELPGGGGKRIPPFSALGLGREVVFF